MYENEIYSGDRTGDHTTGTHQNYQMNTGNIPREPEKRNIPAVLEKSCCSAHAWDFVLDCSAAWGCTRYNRQPALTLNAQSRRRTTCREARFLLPLPSAM